jgi:hypothetical protein
MLSQNRLMIHFLGEYEEELDRICVIQVTNLLHGALFTEKIVVNLCVTDF